MATNVKPGSERSLSDAVSDVVHKLARSMVRARLGDPQPLSEVEARARVWRLPEGRQLAALSRSRYGTQPESVALANVRKDANRHRYSDALRILSKGWDD